MMRVSIIVPVVMLAATIAALPAQAHSDRRNDKNKARCASYGFQEGSDAFANCVMKLSLKQDSRQPPDRDTLVRQYRARSMFRRGDDRYPVCSASMMDNELDTSINKWVGPDCQMAPD